MNSKLAIDVLANDYEKLMRQLAAEKGVLTTDNLPKIARARVTLGVPISQCPCDRKDKERGCISDKCYKEIQDEGRCKCGAFKRRG